jgi:hypothetical protein
MKLNLTNGKLLSASEVSRAVNQPLSRVLKGIKTKVIVPDSTVMDGRLFLFRADRVEEIRTKLSAV